MRVQLRLTGYLDSKVTELVRTLQQAFGLITDRAVLRITREYAEPMLIAWPREPIGVALLRVQEDADPESAVGAAQTIDFVFRNNGIETLPIAGLTVGTRYRFTFEVVG